MLAFCLSSGLFTLSSGGHADEGGAGFWLPGQFASFAASPPASGFYLGTTAYFYDGKGQGYKNSTYAHLLTGTYAPNSKFFGGQPMFSLTWLYGYNRTSTMVPTCGEGYMNLTERSWGVGDLYPMAGLSWNKGVNNGMVYLMGDVPVGAYQPDRLGNMGLGHAAIDAGGAYTYLNEKTGREFSATVGFTYNLENPDTHYRNGIDSHLDLAVSQFLSERLHSGLVGYLYYQLTGDNGPGALRGPFRSQVSAVGPQIGYAFKVGGREWYANLRAYWEFWAEHRLEGYSAYLALQIPLGGPKQK